ncbi:MAG TPA: phospholipase D-like domain-containing protein [Anaerolineales bacterium]|nr:phospholipase D-like domain-containing protein [Anaerolineales bacterium]
MRTHKSLYALIGIALILQACGGNEPAAPTIPPTALVSELPSVTEPAITESLSTLASAEEFLAPIPFRSGLGFRGPWLELYFIDPTNAFAQREVGSVDAIVASSILGATQSVDVSMRFLSLQSITSALVTASRRGIPVRVVAETDNLADRSNFQALKDAGIPIVDDQQPGLLNGSFIVIDRNQVWTGSVDYDVAGMFRKYNTVVRLYSPELAADYTKEFDEMFVNGQFGQLIVPETPYPSVIIQGTQVDVLFSPDDFVVSRLTQLLGGAEKSIHFLAYAFASTELGSIIREKAAQGVAVTGILEADPVSRDQPIANQVEEWNLFQQAGLDVRLDGKPEVMNHKIIIIDGRIVVVGSYDFTYRAENENDENVLIIHNEAIAQKFIEEFERIRSRSQP